ncbi:MAG: Ig-like domain-containing protein [Patescibacteria group bacterium]
MDAINAIVQRVFEEGEHGPYALALPKNPDDLKGSVTFSLKKPVWDDKEDWPERGTCVVLSKFQRKPAGWRAKKARLFKPSDENKGAISMKETKIGNTFLTAALVLVILMISLAGCGQDNRKTQNNTATAVTPPQITDTDGDGIPDGQDNCPFIDNQDQANQDNDSYGDLCDPCPDDPTNQCAVQNHPPTITVNCPASVDDNQSTTCAISASDPDGDQTVCSVSFALTTCTGVTLTGTNNCGSANIPAQGTSAPASCIVAITASDDGTPQLSNTAQDTMTINHSGITNHAPSITVNCPADVNEDAATSCAVSVADSDVPAQTLTCTVAAGTCTGVTLTGCVTANIPAQGEAAGPGSCVVAVTVSDGFIPTPGTATNQDTITINEVGTTNSSPNISLSCPTSINEDALSSPCAISVSDADVPAQTLNCAVAPANTCTGVTLTDCTSANVPAQGETAGPGSCTVAITVTDGGSPNLSNTAQRSITINEVNVAPTISVNCPASVNEDTASSCQLAVQDTDLPIQNLTCSLAPTNTCTGVTLSGCTSANVPAQGEAAPTSCVIAVIVTDNGTPNLSSTASRTIIINEVNIAPTISATCPANIGEDTATTCPLTVSDPDIPTQQLTCTLAGSNTCTGVTLTGSNGCTSANIPAQGEAAGPSSCVLAVTVTDNGTPNLNSTAAHTITINEVNTAPAIMISCPASVNENTATNCTLMASDTDLPFQNLTCSLAPTNTCTGVALNGCISASVLAQGEAAPASCIVAVMVTDSGTPQLSTTNQASINITEVNATPTISVNCPPSINENVSTSCALTANDSDLPTQNLTCSLAPANTCTGVTLTDCTSANVPAQGEAAGPGSCVLAVTVTDNGTPNLSSTAASTITINEVNTAPSIMFTCPNNTNEDTATDCAMMVSDIDQPVQTLACTVSPLTTCTGVTLTDCTAANVPAQGEAAGPGSCTVVVAVTDNGSPAIATSASQTITINEVNVAPAITVNCPASANEDTSTSCALTTTDPDLPANILTCSLAPANTCTGVTLTGCTTALVPAQGENAGPSACIVAITVTDNGSPNLSATNQDSITINEVNVAPVVIVNCPASANEDTSTSCALTATDPDLPANTLTCSLAPTNTCTGVTLTNCTAANVPAQGENAGPGSCIVAVVVTDNGNPNLNSTGQDSITINEVNVAPVVIVDCPASVNQDANASCPLTVTDPDVPFQTLTCTLSAATTCTGVTLSGCSFANVPAQGITTPRTCVVAVTATDNGVPILPTTGQDIIDIINPPLAVDDNYNVDINTSLTVPAPGVLQNDLARYGEPLTVILVSGPSHGVATLGADGALDYIPNHNWYGVDHLTYQIQEGPLVSNIATITIAVNPTPRLRILWAYKQAGLYESTLYSNCFTPYFPPEEWQAQSTQTGHDPSNGNLVIGGLNENGLALGYCVFSIQVPAEMLNECLFGGDNWFPAGQIDPGSTYFCSTLGNIDGSTPADIVFPTVMLTETGVDTAEVQLGVSAHLVDNSGWQYRIDLTHGITPGGDTVPINVDILLDMDGDLVKDTIDNCMLVPNFDQAANPGNPTYVDFIGQVHLVGNFCLGIDNNNDGLVDP